MAFTRKFLSALGIEPEKIDEIIAAHTEVTDALKAERDQFKSDAEKLPDVLKERDEFKAKTDELKESADKLPEIQKELETVQASLKESGEWKSKFETIQAELDDFKKAQSEKETTNRKQAAYRAMLKDLGIAEKRLDTIMRATNLSEVTLDADGKLDGLAELKKAAKDEWADFIEVNGKQGANTENPPSNRGTKMTREEIYKKDERGRYLLDTTARQKALAELMANDE